MAPSIKGLQASRLSSVRGPGKSAAGDSEPDHPELFSGPDATAELDIGALAVAHAIALSQCPSKPVAGSGREGR